MIGDELNKKAEEKEQKKQQNTHNAQNNAKAIRAAANVAEKSGEPHAAVIGAAVNTADKLTGGKSSELLGHALNQGMKITPGGKLAQNAINKAGDSGVLDAANAATSLAGNKKGKTPNNNVTPEKKPQQNNNTQSLDTQNTRNKNKKQKENSSTNTSQATVTAETDKGTIKVLKTGRLLMVSSIVIVMTITLLPLFVILAIITVIIGGNNGTDNIGKAVSFNGYYQNRCEEVTVIFVDSSFNVTGSGTYDMTDYVAGVVAAEVGGFANKEVYKAFALAARTFVELNADNDCSIEGSARRQAFKDITESTNSNHQLIYEAVKETEGQVITSNNSLYSIQYDAFCYATKDSNYYTLVQQDQKIPVEWATKNVWSSAYLNCPCDANDKSMTFCWDTKGNWTDGGHGRGMSQYGALYLATELNYTYDEILSFYYGDENITINSGSLITSIAGLEIKDTRNATELKEPIATYLSSKGTSLDAMNNYIQESVKDVGVGTREGVVTAAVSMINFLYDNFNAKLPYYWGGKVYSKNIPSTFGYYKESDTTRGGNKNYYISFDCSGFVSWSIIAGGYNFNSTGTSGIDSQFSKNSCNISESSCIGQPGDLINSSGGHVELIIDVDIENEKYFVAQSTGSGVVMNQRDMHQVHEGKITKILFLEEYYNNPENINNNY